MVEAIGGSKGLHRVAAVASRTPLTTVELAPVGIDVTIFAAAPALAEGQAPNRLSPVEQRRPRNGPSLQLAVTVDARQGSMGAVEGEAELRVGTEIDSRASEARRLVTVETLSASLETALMGIDVAGRTRARPKSQSQARAAQGTADHRCEEAVSPRIVTGTTFGHRVTALEAETQAAMIVSGQGAGRESSGVMAVGTVSCRPSAAFELTAVGILVTISTALVGRSDHDAGRAEAAPIIRATAALMAGPTFDLGMLAIEGPGGPLVLFDGEGRRHESHDGVAT